MCKWDGRIGKLSARGALAVLAAAVLLASAQTACSKKTRVAVEDSGPVRVVVLPFAFAVDEGLDGKSGAMKPADMQWMAMAAPALLLKASRQYPDLDMVPLPDVMPTAIAAAQAARSFTDESASSLANWVSAQWAVVGEVRQVKRNSYSVVVDFIPAKSTDVPFRHIKSRKLENIGMSFQGGLRQWLRYTTGKRIPLTRAKQPGLDKMKPLGEALDREYGWLVSAEPGAAKESVEAAMAEDEEWAKLLFSPTMYPQLAPAK
jgi:hypothetical protein